MTISSTSNFNVTAQAPVSAVLATIVQPGVGAGTGRGRLIHPTLGIYDYPTTPDYYTNMDGDAVITPRWAHSETLGGSAEALWNGSIRDLVCKETWYTNQGSGDVGSVLSHLRMLQFLIANPPDPTVPSFVQWLPNYNNGHVYNVLLLGVTAGGQDYQIDARAAKYATPYAPAPVELSLRIVAKVS